MNANDIAETAARGCELTKGDFSALARDIQAHLNNGRSVDWCVKWAARTIDSFAALAKATTAWGQETDDEEG